MRKVSINRREAIAGMAGLSCAIAGTRVFGASSYKSTPELSHDAAIIRQQVDFNIPTDRIYLVLTDASAFDAMTTQETDMKVLDKPSILTGDVGASFSLFGGYITGRHVELIPNQRIVQAWRTGGWNAGAYSIVSMDFSPKDGGTRLVFEHRGFPDSEGDHLMKGWHLRYWEPLKKYLV